MRLTVVGCAAAWSRQPGMASSCYLVEHAGRAVALDLGQGTFSELSRYRDPATLDGVLVSHLHPDHLVDLVPLRHFTKYGDAAEPARLHGPTDLRRRLDGLTAESGFLDILPGDALAEGRFEVAGMVVEARHVTHIPDSYAFRLVPANEPTSPGLVYSGDCAVAEDLLPLIHPGDTLLCEAFYGAGEPGPLHINAAQAAEVAGRGGAARLVLTHVREREARDALLAAAAIFRGDLLAAEPGLRLDIG